VYGCCAIFSPIVHGKYDANSEEANAQLQRYAEFDVVHERVAARRVHHQVALVSALSGAELNVMAMSTPAATTTTNLCYRWGKKRRTGEQVEKRCIRSRPGEAEAATGTLLQQYPAGRDRQRAGMLGLYQYLGRGMSLLRGVGVD
jgi:hypothetical protein